MLGTPRWVLIAAPARLRKLLAFALDTVGKKTPPHRRWNSCRGVGFAIATWTGPAGGCVLRCDQWPIKTAQVSFTQMEA